ncbi:non-hydrolyzing UDP-N-acetylglucosamine 2-epimerase [Nitratireductor sp. PBL-C9]|uniref:non-hydrolyzing UDP-N-acetylglucosamine 2-epimerase n=1 Tax=Nitratireductor sp. PBL-C9 TaxID=3435013 RepID=UPI003D7C81D9
MSNLRIATIIGARPQFVKAAPLSLEIANTAGIEEISIHTGQHYDANMSDVFFSDLALPRPAYNLGISGGSHGKMTGEMLAAIETILTEQAPDAVLVYGDTNSTLAGGLAAAKLNIPVIHVEAGLRSFNRKMPEEINRVMVDHVSALLFCPTSTSVENLAREGITKGVHQVGDLMFDATLTLTPIAEEQSKLLEELDLSPSGYCAATLHRADNTASPEAIEKALRYMVQHSDGKEVVIPLHPRTRHAAERFNISVERDGIRVVEPLGYIDMIKLAKNAALIFTDSGGLQKEAYFHGVPCVTLRSETEWIETVTSGWNRLWSEGSYAPRTDIAEYGDGSSAKTIVNIIKDWSA